MTIRDLLNKSELTLNHLLSSSLDSEVILSFVLDKPREYILAHLDEKISNDSAKRFNDLIARRVRHEPVAYLIHNKEFYGRNFYVDNRVHIPRPGTEDLINCVKRSATLNRGRRPFQIADIGTGSGCIAITLALEFPNAKIIATDISDGALNVARQNADALSVKDRIAFLKGNLLEPITQKVDTIIANLPYGWKEFWTSDKEVFFQPKESYDGGENGLELIKKLIADLNNHLAIEGKCFLEFDPRQTESIKQIAKDNNFNISIKKDLAGFDRIAILTKRENQP